MATKRSGLGARRGAIATALAVSDDAPPALSGEVLPPSPAPLPAPQTVDDFAGAIQREWENAQQRFVRIGELLDAAELTLARPDYMQLVSCLPFGKAARSQLLTAYRAIKSGRIPPQVAAAGYSTVYEIAKMPDEMRAKAKKAGLMRPDVKQAEVKAFVRDLRPAAPAASRADIEAELARVEARASELRELLKGLVD